MVGGVVVSASTPPSADLRLALSSNWRTFPAIVSWNGSRVARPHNLLPRECAPWYEVRLMDGRIVDALIRSAPCWRDADLHFLLCETCFVCMYEYSAHMHVGLFSAAHPGGMSETFIDSGPQNGAGGREEACVSLQVFSYRRLVGRSGSAER